MKSYIPCHRLKSHIVFYGRHLAFCCGDGGRKCGPRWDWGGDGIESIEDFFSKRELLYQELNGLREIDLLRPCIGCRDLKEGKEPEDVVTLGKIDFLNYGFIPTFCQCSCIYCSFVGCELDNGHRLAKEAGFAAKFADVMNYLEKNALLSDRFSIQVASGEITAHPERDELLRIVMKYPCHWFTNAFIYDEVIADNLRCNKTSSICVSLDCGTSETFKRIKGYNMFEKVIGNLRKYNERGKIIIKYIVIPGINDSLPDYNGIIALLKTLNQAELSLSRDTFTNLLPFEVLESSALLYSMCKVNNIRITGDMFSKTEWDEIHRLVKRGFGTHEMEDYENSDTRRYFYDKELSCSNFTHEYRNYFFAREFARKSTKIKEFIGARKAVIWGAGANGALLTDMCCCNGIDVYVTDIDSVKHGTIISNKAVAPFNEISDKVDIILLSNGGFFDSVKEQVGVQYEIIDFFSLLSDF